MVHVRVAKRGIITCPGDTAGEAIEYLQQTLDEPWHGNVLLSCGPQKLEAQQRLSEFNDDFVFANFSCLSSGPPLRISDTALRGITVQQLSCLLGFVEEIVSGWCDAHHLAYGQPLTYQAFNLYHADFWVIGPATAGHGRGGCSYVELVATDEKIQRPLWFVSHAWLEPVCQFALCLKRHAALRELSDQTSYWVCAYANNQHQLQEEICQNPRKTSFYRAIKMCAGVLLILDENATPFTRIWCCFEESIAVEERNKGTPLMLDVAATEHGRAHVITDGLAGIEQKMMPFLAFLVKSQREAEFPAEILMKGLNVEIASAMASKASDKNRILNSLAFPRARTQVLLEDAQAAHDSYESVSRALAGHFALANWFSSVANSLDTSRLLTALQDDVKRREVKLSLTGCNFDGAQLATLLEHLPPQLQILRLDLGFTAVESVEVQHSELQELSLRFTNTALRQMKLQRSMMPKLRSLQLWLSNLSDLEELQLDLSLNCQRTLRQLVLHVHGCPKLPQTAKQSLYRCVEAWPWHRADQWISIEEVQEAKAVWFVRSKVPPDEKQLRSAFHSGKDHEVRPFPCAEMTCMEFHDNLHGYCHKHRFKRFWKKACSRMMKGLTWLELIFILSVQAAAEIRSRFLLLLVLLSILPVTCLFLEEITGLSAALVCVTLLVVAVGSCFYAAKRVDAIQHEIFKMSLETEASYFQVLQSANEHSNANGSKQAFSWEVVSILGPSMPSTDSVEPSNTWDLRSNFAEAGRQMPSFQSLVCEKLSDLGQAPVVPKLKSLIELEDGADGAVDVLYCEVICDGLQQVQHAWHTLKNLDDVTVMSAHDFFAVAGPRKCCRIVVSIHGYFATVFLMERSLSCQPRNDVAHSLGLLDGTAKWEVSRLESARKVPLCVSVATAILRAFAFLMCIVMIEMYSEFKQYKGTAGVWMVIAPFLTCAFIILWETRCFCCCCCCCRRGTRGTSLTVGPRPTQIWYRKYLGVEGKHYHFKVAALQCLTVVLQTVGKASLFQGTPASAVRSNPNYYLLLGLLLCNIVFPALVCSFPNRVFSRVGAAVMDGVLDLGYPITTLRLYSQMYREGYLSDNRFWAVADFWNYMSIYVCVAHVTCVCRAVETANWVVLLQESSTTPWLGPCRRILLSAGYACALLVLVIALLGGFVFADPSCPPCECSTLGSGALLLERCAVPAEDDCQFISNNGSIDLGHQMLGAISPGVFRCGAKVTASAREVHLEGNQLDTIPPGAFQGLRVLRLYLQDNDLTHLHTDSFCGMTWAGAYSSSNSLFWDHSQSLDILNNWDENQSLDISNNKLQTLPRQMLVCSKDAAYVRFLNLAHNELSHLPEDTFEGLSGLDKLNLQGNRLQQLPSKIFSSLKLSSLFPLLGGWGLELNLQQNQLRELHRDIFVHLWQLLDLKLGGNQLTALPPGLFRKQSQLKNLQLDGNQLRQLPKDLFWTRFTSKLKNLKTLNLSQNQLDGLPAGLFDGLVSMHTLDLSYNQLRTLDPLEFRDLPKLTTLDLRGNPLREDIKLNLTQLGLKELNVD